MAELPPTVPQPLPTPAESTSAVEESQAAPAAHVHAEPAAVTGPEADVAVQTRINVCTVLKLTYSSPRTMIHSQTLGMILQIQPHFDHQF
jgi:hypothetical protein